MTESGKLFTFGEAEGGKLGLGPDIGNSDQTSPCEVTLPEPVTGVSCGSGHTMVVTVSGHVYTWGQSSHGQLGLGNKNKTLRTDFLHG